MLARAQQRKVYIHSAGRSAWASQVVAHLAFDGYLDSSQERPATDKSPSILARTFGDKGYDYVGDGLIADFIWREACSIHVSGPSTVSERVDGEASLRWSTSLKTWLDALRVHQYAKNTLVFVPVLTSHQFSASAFISAALAFIAFSLCASGAYLLNDVVDLKSDRAHPIKRNRPISAGSLSVSSALVAVPCLWLASAAVALMVSSSFLAVIAAYLATTLAYSLYFKKKVLVDIVVLSALYTLRIFGGAVAIEVYLSEWLMIFSLFIFTSLALIKRYAEMALHLEDGLQAPSSRDYRTSDVNIIGALAAASGFNAITVLSLYVSSEIAIQAYSRPWMLWLLNPLLLYWIGRALIAAHRQEMREDPLVYTFKDRSSRIAILIMMCTVLAAI